MISTERRARAGLDHFRPHQFFIERERAESGEVVPVATVFLTNRQCPWRCLYCDLWKNALTETVPPGAIPAQIDFALGQLGRNESNQLLASSGGTERTTLPSPSPRPSPSGRGRIAPRDRANPSALTFLETENHNSLSPRERAGVRGNDAPTDATDVSTEGDQMGTRETRPSRVQQIKLYNAGSFFDPKAIPPGDFAAIAERVRGFERVIVECHPALVGESAVRFRDLLSQSSIAPQLEVAMGLEIADDAILTKLNKRMTLALFRRAAEFLVSHGIAVRAFIIVKPPFVRTEADALEFARCSIDFAFDCRAGVVSLIPARFGPEELERLAQTGDFAPPALGTLEAALDYGLAQRRGRVFADLWDVEKLSKCPDCFPARRQRLARINGNQANEPNVMCPCQHAPGVPPGRDESGC